MSIIASLINIKIRIRSLELHRIFTFAGALLLVVTFLVNSEYVESGGNGTAEFNYAYVTGIAMIATFVAGFAIFTIQKMKRGFAS